MALSSNVIVWTQRQTDKHTYTHRTHYCSCTTNAQYHDTIMTQCQRHIKTDSRELFYRTRCTCFSTTSTYKYANTPVTGDVRGVDRAG